jgi:protein SCO1/2
MRVGSIFVLGAALMVIFGASWIASVAPALQLPRLGKAPAFSLIMQDGSEFSSHKLQGQVWVTGAFFTSCSATCPLILRELKKVEAQIPAAEKFNFVLLSVDPQYDTPKVLQEFAQKNQVSPQRWTLLTGAKNVVESVVSDGFKLASKEEPLLHSNRFYLVDKEGEFRGSYSIGDSEAMLALVADIKKLL